MPIDASEATIGLAALGIGYYLTQRGSAKDGGGDGGGDGGDGGDGGGDGGGGDDGDKEIKPQTYNMTLKSLASNPETRYFFRLGSQPSFDMSVESRLQPEPAETTQYGDDYIYQLADGTWIIEGSTGTADNQPPAYGDSYTWRAADPDTMGILGFEANHPPDQYTIMVNGQEVDPATLPTLTVSTS